MDRCQGIQGTGSPVRPWGFVGAKRLWGVWGMNSLPHLPRLGCRCNYIILRCLGHEDLSFLYSRRVKSVDLPALKSSQFLDSSFRLSEYHYSSSRSIANKQSSRWLLEELLSLVMSSFPMDQQVLLFSCIDEKPLLTSNRLQGAGEGALYLLHFVLCQYRWSVVWVRETRIMTRVELISF